MTGKQAVCKALELLSGTEEASYGGESKEKCTENFIVQFGAIKPASAEQYDKQRQKNSPSWQTIARYNGKKRWTELLSSLGLTKAAETSAELTVTRTIRLGGMYISDEEWRDGKPSVETVSAAVEDKLNIR